MTDCPRCHATSRAGAHFCRRCGVLLGSHCPRCGQECFADSDFCDNCGLPLSPQAWGDWDRFGSTDAGDARASRPLVFSAHGALALATGDFSRALSLMDELERLSGVLHCEACLPQTLYLKGQALRGLGRRDEALEALGRACVAAQAMGERRYAWRILAALAEIETERGTATGAQRLLRQAREIIDHIASHAGPAELRESFLDTPAVRAVLGQDRAGAQPG